MRIGAQVACPACEEVFRIEDETLEGGGPGGAALAGGRAGSRGGEPEEDVLQGEEPEAMVGLSGLSGLMHGAEDAHGGGDGESEGEAGFPGNTGAHGSFKGAADSGIGVPAELAPDEDDGPAPGPAGGGRRDAPPPRPIEAPPTRDQLRKARARERREAAERARSRRRLTLVVVLAVGLAAGFIGGLFALLGEAPAERAPEPAPRPAPIAAAAPPAPTAEPATVYARSTAAGRPEPLPGVAVAAMPEADPLGQTRRIAVTLRNDGEAVAGPLRLHLSVDPPDAAAWGVSVPGGLAAGRSRELTVSLVPPLPVDGRVWTVIPAR